MAAYSTAHLRGTPQSRTRSFAYRLKAGDELAYVLTLAAASAVILIVALLVYQLWISSRLPIHKFGFSFLNGSNVGSAMRVISERCPSFLAPA